MRPTGVEPATFGLKGRSLESIATQSDALAQGTVKGPRAPETSFFLTFADFH
jgi:hypothetical protein